MGEPEELTPVELESLRRRAAWTRRSAFLILLIGTAAAAWPFAEGSYLVGVVVAGLFGFASRNAWVRGSVLEAHWTRRLGEGRTP